MDANSAIKGSLQMGEMVSMSYLGDLTDNELMQRPHPKCNHINWQIGHLICSEHSMMDQLAPGTMPALPDGFADKYSRETVGSDDASSFASKNELMQVYKDQRAATLKLLDKTSAEDLDAATGVDYAPTKGAMFRLLGEHWLMHCGQWVIVRRENGKPIVM